MRTSARCAMAGSSPLARGARGKGRLDARYRGLIPARAGSTITGSVLIWPMRAHPRSRGEHAVASYQVEDPTGSSPLARGAHGVGGPAAASCGLIPARAGSTLKRPGCLPSMRAHPRSRGEHFWEGTVGVYRQGSSPLARGAPISIGWVPIRVGLIPARAGSTRTSFPKNFRLRAHPRSRGEHSYSTPSASSSAGSSPLARGALLGSLPWFSSIGLIPARAGSTWLFLFWGC